jgi:hypothetical protein
MKPYYKPLSPATREELIVRLEEVRRINFRLQEQIVAERQRVQKMASELHELKKKIAAAE